MSANRALLRIAGRSIRKAPLRSLLVFVLVALLVATGTGSAIIGRSLQPSDAERTASQRGAAQLAIDFGDSVRLPPPFVDIVPSGSIPIPAPVGAEGATAQEAIELQREAAESAARAAEAAERARQAAIESWQASFDPVQITSEVGGQLSAPVTLRRIGRSDFPTQSGPFGLFGGDFEITDIDMANPLAHGTFELLGGTYPTSDDEAAVSPTFGPGTTTVIGDRIVVGETELTVVGHIVRKADQWGDQLLVTPTTFDRLAHPDRGISYQLLAGPSWASSASWVNLVEVGATIGTDITVTTDAGWTFVRSDGETSTQSRDDHDGYHSTFDGRYYPSVTTEGSGTVLVPLLISIAFGVQIALIAAAAFTIGVRRRTQEFGQLATLGANTGHTRRLVLFEAVLLGLLGTLAGTALGAGIAWKLIDAGLFVDATSRYANDVRWVPLDWIGPAAIGILAIAIAAWRPATEIARTHVLSALAGHQPAGRPAKRTGRIGVLAFTVGVLVAALGLTLANSDGFYFTGLSAALLIMLIVVGVLAMFVGALLTVGQLLSWVGQQADRFPLLPRLVARNADRNRARSWVVVGAFIATMAVPVLIGASIKAYPGSYASLDERTATTAALLYGRCCGEGPVEFTDEIRRFDAAFGDAAVEVLGDHRTARVDQVTAEIVAGGPTQVRIVGPGDSILDFPQDGAFTAVVDSRQQTVGTMLLATPELIEILDLSNDLVDQLDEDTVVDLRSYRNYPRFTNGQGRIVLSPSEPGDFQSLDVEVIAGPAMFRDNSFTAILVSPQLASSLDLETSQLGTLRIADNPISRDQSTALRRVANEEWSALFGTFDPTAPRSFLADDPPEPAQNRLALTIQDENSRGASPQLVRLLAIIITTGLAALIAFVTSSLSAVEIDREMQSMIANGAPPSMRSMMLGAQTTYHLVLAAVLGIPLAIVLFWAVTRSDQNGPNGITIPWATTAIMALVVPVFVGLAVAAVFRNGKPAISRRLS